MKSFLQPLTVSSRQRASSRPPWLTVSLLCVRHMSRSAEAHADVISTLKIGQETNAARNLSFLDLGLHPPIIASLQKAFPNVKHPTESQAKFIPAVLGDRDVLLKDETGSGKSFGLVLALLNKPRLKLSLKGHRDTREKRLITSLVVVPHRDLAYQLVHWIQRIVDEANTASIASIVQVLVREGGSHLTSGIDTLRKEAPHILIGTPQALMDVYQKDPDVLQLSTLSSVVVDEVDYLIPTIPRKDPRKSFRAAYEKSRRKLLAHPGLTRELLDIIYAGRKEVNERRRDEPGMARYERSTGEADRSQLYPKSPQLILSSATLRVGLNNYIFEESGWLNRDTVLKVKGKNHNSQKPPGPLSAPKDDSLEDGLGGTGISHSVLIVSEYEIKNVSGAIKQEKSAPSEEYGYEVTPDMIFNAPDLPIIESEVQLQQKYANTKSPFNPNAFEAIATAFALDVPSIALLVLPSSAPVQRAVHELREMGVNAHGLDLLVAEKGQKHLLNNCVTVQDNPTLLVATLATTRGLDLPELTHVFILGIPEGPRVTGQAVDAYIHLSGRVGRFGRGGKVITVVEGKDDVSEKGKEHVEDGGILPQSSPTDASKMLRILGEIQEKPVHFEHFD